MFEASTTWVLSFGTVVVVAVGAVAAAAGGRWQNRQMDAGRSRVAIQPRCPEGDNIPGAARARLRVASFASVSTNASITPPSVTFTRHPEHVA
uniref:Putative secreted peptide n=1 Tax=Anopheles braziliensis TaxID=58242 RepID=A0A2M3ZTT2_9DIPT